MARLPARIPPIARLAGVLALALAGVTCRDRDPVGPGLPTQGSIAVAPRLERAAGGAGPGFIALRTVRGVLTPIGGGRGYTVDASFVNDTATLAFDVTFPGATQRYTLALAAIDTAGDTLFRSMREVTATPGTNAPVHDTLRYAAPDTAVAFLAFTAADTLVVGTDTIAVSVTGYDRREQAVSRVYLDWSSSDTTVARVVSSGPASVLVIGQDIDSTAWIVGRAFNGVADSLRLRVAFDIGAVAIASDTVRTLAGSAVTASATVFSRGGVSIDRTVAWESLDTAVAVVQPLVSQLGTAAAAAAQSIAVSGVRAGATRIVARSGTKADTSVVVVDPVPPVIVGTLVSPSPVELHALGQVVKLSAHSRASDSTTVTGTYRWRLGVDANRVSAVSVDSAGTVTALAVGSAWVVAEEAGGTADSASVTVTQVPQSVAVSGPVTVDATGIDVVLRASATDSLGSAIPNAVFDWKLTNDSIASIVLVDADSAILRSARYGSTLIVASAGSASGTTQLSVVQTATTLRLTPAAVTLGLDGRAQLDATLLDANGAPIVLKPGELAWGVEGQTGIVDVDSAGEVHAKGFGSTGVFATARGIRSGTTKVDVSDASPLAITFMADSLAMTADSARVSVFLSTAPTQLPVTVTLTDSTGLVRFGTDTLVFDVGQARHDVMVYGSFSGSVVVSAADAGKSYAPATLVVTGPLPAKLRAPARSRR